MTNLPLQLQLPKILESAMYAWSLQFFFSHSQQAFSATTPPKQLVSVKVTNKIPAARSSGQSSGLIQTEQQHWTQLISSPSRKFSVWQQRPHIFPFQLFFFHILCDSYLPNIFMLEYLLSLLLRMLLSILTPSLFILFGFMVLNTFFMLMICQLISPGRASVLTHRFIYPTAYSKPILGHLTGISN